MATAQGSNEGLCSSESMTAVTQGIEDNHNSGTSKSTTAARQDLADDDRQRECAQKWKTSTIGEHTPAWKCYADKKLKQCGAPPPPGGNFSGINPPILASGATVQQ